MFDEHGTVVDNLRLPILCVMRSQPVEAQARALLTADAQDCTGGALTLVAQ